MGDSGAHGNRQIERRDQRGGLVVIADSVAEATILFCDLVGFTTLSAELTAGRTIDFLSKIFSAFDSLATEHGAVLKHE